MGVKIRKKWSLFWNLHLWKESHHLSLEVKRSIKMVGLLVLDNAHILGYTSAWSVGIGDPSLIVYRAWRHEDFLEWTTEFDAQCEEVWIHLFVWMKISWPTVNFYTWTGYL